AHSSSLSKHLDHRGIGCRERHYRLIPPVQQRWPDKPDTVFRGQAPRDTFESAVAMRGISQTERCRDSGGSVHMATLPRTQQALGLAQRFLGRVDELFDDKPGSNQMNQRQKGLAQFLISCRNTAKLFEAVEEPFHFLASLVQVVIIRDGVCAIALEWYHRHDVLGKQVLTDGMAVIA